MGEIVGTHGVKGELRVNPWSDTPCFLKQFQILYLDSAGTRAVKVTSARVHGNLVLLCLLGIDSVEAAQAMRGKVLFMRRKDAALADGDYFIAELIGCEVRDADNPGTFYGTITDVSRTGANDVWHIRDDLGRESLLPAVAEFVIHTDIEKGLVQIRPIEGMLADED